jgi:23S rRNA pseudouridine1911/1915/1917 synthase
LALNHGWSYREQVRREAAGRTVLEYLAATRTHSTAAEWAARLDAGEVEVGGIRAEPGQVIAPGQVLVWHRPPWDEPDVPTAFTILHEDDALVAVDKPSGLPTMPAGGFLNHTLLAFLRRRYPNARPLHRLGRHTSGVVLFARTAAAAAALGSSWREHAVHKTYRALASGVTRGDMFVIDAAIGPVPHPRLGAVEAANENGRPSHSVAAVLERRPGRTLFRVDITTGRPHQIRIHLAYAGHPLVGDGLYETGGTIRQDPGLPGDGGYFLHAEKLAFPHPATGAATTIAAPPPRELLTQAELAATESVPAR